MLNHFNGRQQIAPKKARTAAGSPPLELGGYRRLTAGRGACLTVIES
jgi:hypothetical protein